MEGSEDLENQDQTRQPMGRTLMDQMMASRRQEAKTAKVKRREVWSMGSAQKYPQRSGVRVALECTQE